MYKPRPSVVKSMVDEDSVYCYQTWNIGTHCYMFHISIESDVDVFGQIVFRNKFTGWVFFGIYWIQYVHFCY